MEPPAQQSPTRIFEISWEVCNKVGGINTVLESKTPFMIVNYTHDRYTMIGPYVKQKADVDFEKRPVPDRFAGVFSRLAADGIECHYGTWSIHDEPEVILIDFGALVPKRNEWRTIFWESFRIDSINARWDFDEPMLFSVAAGMLINEYQRQHAEDTTVAHFHEWMTGIGLLYLRREQSKVATVFTTHATILGRSIAGSGLDLYGMLETINPDEWAYKLDVQEKHTAERACAQQADIFTTVSEITGLEAEKLLGRKPEVLLFNGLSIEKFATFEETSIKHVASREKIREFVAYYFFPYYSFDIEHVLLMFITARYEHTNKGFDILIEALRRLNEHLKAQQSSRTIVFFFWVPLGTAGVKKEIVENKNLYYHIKTHVDWHSQHILKQITLEFLRLGQDFAQGNAALEGRALANLFDPEFIHDVKKGIQHFKRQGNPPITTHELIDPQNIPLFTQLLAAGLDNKPDDRVKTIIYPAYLDGADSLLNLPYYDAIVGTHLGIFPSYYEPWGYTPLEAAALAVPAITTDLAGFGRFVQQHQHKKEEGIFVMQRFGKSHEEEIDALFKLLLMYSAFDHVERVENRLVAKNLSQLADWSHFVKRYVQAHELATERARQRGA